MLRVLLVEDNPIYRAVFKEDLREHFPTWLIDEARDGDEAWQKIRAAAPDLIFMDFRLPGVNGLQLTQRVRKDFPGVRIVLLTGHDLPEYRQAAFQCGADHFCVKGSFKWDELETVVKSIRSPSNPTEPPARKQVEE